MVNYKDDHGTLELIVPYLKLLDSYMSEDDFLSVKTVPRGNFGHLGKLVNYFWLLDMLLESGP